MNSILLKSTLLITFITLDLALNAQYVISNNCGSDLQTEVFMKGIQGESTSFIDIGNISTTTQLVVDVWIESDDCTGAFPSTITITNGSQTFTPSGTVVAQTSTIPENVYRVTVNNPTNNIVYISNLASCYASSVSVQKVSTNTGSASYVQAIDREFHNNNMTYVTNIGSATQARTIRVSVPIHEKDNLGLIARVEVWGTGVTLLSKEITMQTNGNEAGLIEINVPNIPVSITQLNVKIISPMTSGASFGVGLLTASTVTPCSIPCSSLTPDTGPDKTICPSSNTVITVNTTGGTPPYTYAWNNTTYPAPNTNPSKTVSPSTNTNYSITVTDAIGCTATNNILVSIMANSSCTEICNNGIDDDADGLTDCEDDACYLVSNSGDSDYDNDGIGDICDLDDDNDGITDADEGCPNCNGGIFINGNFESNMTHSSVIQTNEENILGWNTTAPDNKIEIWRTGFLGVPSKTGNYHSEINSSHNAALYQRVCSKPGTQFSWSVWHRGRGGIDEAVVRIGNSILNAPIQATMLTGTAGWVQYSGTYTVPLNEVETYFLFEAVSTGSGSIGSGNFVDDIIIMEITPGTCLDTDGDGIENYQDNDSDNDGCPDAIEGSLNVLSTDIDINSRILGLINIQGIPIFVSGGQGYGASQNSTILNCPEVCDDGIDNNGDGLIDCDAPDCQISPPIEIIHH